MKQFMKSLLLGTIATFAIVFSGCEFRHDANNYEKHTSIKQGVYMVGHNDKNESVYVKGVLIEVGNNGGNPINQILYLYCDKDGNLIGNGAITYDEKSGKTTKTTTIQ